MAIESKEDVCGFRVPMQSTPMQFLNKETQSSRVAD